MTIQPEASQTLQRSSYDLKTYRENNVDQSLPRQHFRVSREEGSEELKREILGCYKQPSNKLKAAMVVRFEGEGGTGSGPIREFLLCAMNILDEGIGMKDKPLVFLEGEDDHKLPIHDLSLRCTGAYKAIGRIIGHSVLHGGPFLYGISPAVKHYWCVTGSKRITDKDVAIQALPIVPEDISDLELRNLISQVQYSTVITCLCQCR
jgi:hypothetical protein